MGKPLRQQARASTLEYVDAVAQALTRPDVTPSKASAAQGRVVGPALAALQNQAAEMADLGQRIEGRPRVVSSVVTAHSESPPSMTVAACLDNSGVRVLGRGGRRLAQPASTDKRTLNILSLRRLGRDWVVTGQTFPDNPDC